MKKMLNIVLSATLALSLAACGGNQTEAPVGGTSAPQPQVQEPAQSAPEVQQPEVQEPEVEEPQTEEPTFVSIADIPVPEEVKDFQADSNDEYSLYINRNIGFDVVSGYLAALEDEGFTITEDTVEPNVYAVSAVGGNAEVAVYYETADWDLTDPEMRANGGAGLDTSILQVEIFWTPAEEPETPQGSQMSFDLPEGNWTSDDHNSGQFCFHKNTSYDLTLEDAQNYVETLKNDSYWFNFEVTDGEGDGEIYFFSAFGEDPKLNRVTVSVRETGDPGKPLMTMVTFREIVD